MNKHLNNKGYMLVEIILAFVLAMGVAYFIMDLTIKLKNKNDDLLVKTLVYTDQAIIYNEIMEDLYKKTGTIDCSYVDDKLDISNNTFTYNGFKNIITEYATVGAFTCNDTGTNSVNIKIPIKVKQLPDEVFDVVINYGTTTPDDEELNQGTQAPVATCSVGEVVSDSSLGTICVVKATDYDWVTETKTTCTDEKYGENYKKCGCDYTCQDQCNDYYPDGPLPEDDENSGLQACLDACWIGPCIRPNSCWYEYTYSCSVETTYCNTGWIQYSGSGDNLKCYRLADNT